MGDARGPSDRQGLPKNIVEQRTAKNATTPMMVDLSMFSTKKIANVELVMKQNEVPVTLDLDLVKNKKDVIGSVWGKKINGLWGFCLRVDLFTSIQGKRDRWVGCPPDWGQ
jgi:hypothetical protein